MALTQVIGSGIGQVTDIKLGGSGADNTLDDYEEGTFTPAFGAVTVSSYTSRSGHYTKIGRLVHVQVSMTVSGLNTADTSGMQISLPFTADGSALSLVFSYDPSLSTLLDSNHDQLHGARISAGSTLVFGQVNGTDLTYAEGCNANGVFNFAFTYESA